MNQIDLRDRVALVTGGAQGIGFAIAQRFLQSGAQVWLWDIDGPRVGTAAEALRAFGPVQTACVDLCDEAAVAAAAQTLLDHAGRIEIVVNNAGITGGNARSWELEPAVWRRVVEVNLIAPVLVCRALVPAMIARAYGRIVNIASIAGKEGNANAAHYSASKAGLIALTKSLGKELAGTGVSANAVTPAAAKTAIFDSMTPQHIEFMLSRIPLGRFVQVEEIAALVAWLASEECSFSTGAVFDISGGRATY